MRVFVTGATGGIGRPLLAQLIDAGHEVTVLTRSEAKADAVRARGAQVAVGDALDRAAVLDAVTAAEPEAVIHQATALSGVTSMRDFDRVFAQTNRLRTEGTEHLLAAARASGARRFLAQSFAGWTYGSDGIAPSVESDAFVADPPARQRETLAAIRRLEQLTLGAEGLTGIVLRYAGFYGPGNDLSRDGAVAALVRKRRLPIVGDGRGVMSFIHVEDAAAATVAALERGERGVYNVADDEPARVSEWLPELAAVLGAKPPRRVPVWLARIVAGDVPVSLMTRANGISNAKARRRLGWEPRYPSFREGFREGLEARDHEPVSSRA